MEPSIYSRLIRRWAWLVILAAVVAGTASFVANRSRPPQYEASTTVEIGNYLNSLNPNAGTITLAEQLTQTYSDKLTTFPILKAVLDKLNLPMTTDTLATLVKPSHAPGSSLLIISVTYTDPIIANELANELANQLIASSPTNLTSDQQQQLVILQNEIQHAEADLQSARDELATVNASVDTVTGEDQAVLLARKQELTTQIGLSQNSLAQLLATTSSLQQEGSANTLRVVQPSRVPDTPISAPVTTAVLFAAGAAASLAAGAGALIEYLDNTVRSPSEVLPLLSVPLLGAVAPFGKRGTYENKLIAWTQPQSPIAESYRSILVNLLFREKQEDGDRSFHLFVVTSPGPGEGKSVTTANLAVTFVNSGMRVLVVDADLHRPAMHQIFNLPNTMGLSNLWQNGNHAQSTSRSAYTVEEMDAVEALQDNGPIDTIILNRYTQKTEIPNLDVITTGQLLKNTSKFLRSPQMRELIRQIADSQKYDAVFFDTPPALVITDSSIIASIAKAKVIGIIEAGRTQRLSAKRLVKQLTELSIPITGVILNRLHPRDLDDGYGQYYYSYSRYAGKGSKSSSEKAPLKE